MNEVHTLSLRTTFSTPELFYPVHTFNWNLNVFIFITSCVNANTKITCHNGIMFLNTLETNSKMKNMFFHFPESQTLCWDNSSNRISLIYTVTALAWLVNNTKERNSPHIIINMCCSVCNALCTVVQLNRGRWRGKKLRNTAHSSRTHSSALSEEQVHDSPLLEPRGITNRSTHNSPKQLPSGCIIFIWITEILINWLCITNNNVKNDMTVKLSATYFYLAHM